MNDEFAKNNDQAMTADEVEKEMKTDEDIHRHGRGHSDIDIDTLDEWWRRREAKKWTSTVSFFVLFLCVAMTPLLTRALHESRARLLQT